MSCYFIAQLLIYDEDKYKKYLNGFDSVFEKYEGKVIAVEENPIILEGDWDYSRLVIIRFSNENEARRWYHSSEYQSLLQHRLNASKGTVLLINDRSDL
jgi:uncharacterized protein (DUF1330 family)